LVYNVYEDTFRDIERTPQDLDLFEVRRLGESFLLGFRILLADNSFEPNEECSTDFGASRDELDSIEILF